MRMGGRLWWMGGREDMETHGRTDIRTEGTQFYKMFTEEKGADTHTDREASYSIIILDIGHISFIKKIIRRIFTNIKCKEKSKNTEFYSY